MAMKPETAKKIAEELTLIVNKFNDIALVAQEQCPKEEFDFCRMAIGKVLGEMKFELLDPFFTKYPAVKPKDYKL